MTGNTSICILVPTSSKYESVAKFTISLLDRYWNPHPEIFVCGGGSENDKNRLATSTSPEDWIGTLLAACRHLIQLGYRHTYLILDDHPPLAFCHDRHLNHTLPALLDELDATCVGLNGRGIGRDGRKRQGNVLGSDYYRLERLPQKFEWKYSLHPSLWNLDRLTTLLGVLVESLTPPDRTPWRFERLSGRPGLDLPFDYPQSAYRVCGSCMTSSKRRLYTHYAKFFAARLSRLVFNRVGTSQMADLAEKRLTIRSNYYEGPYPLYWSGIITAGRVNPRFIDFVRSSWCPQLYTLLTSDVIPAFNMAQGVTKGPA